MDIYKKQKKLKYNKRFFNLLFIIIAILLSSNLLYYYDLNNGDNYQTLRYAKNLIEHQEFTYNKGETPTNENSNYLWIIISAISILINCIKPLFLLKIFSILSLIYLLWIVFELTRFFTSNISIYWALIPLILISVSGLHSIYAVSGGDTMLFTALLLHSILLSFKMRILKNHALIVAVFWILTSLCRFEGIIFAIIIYASILIRELINKRKDFRFIKYQLIAYGGFLIVYFLLSYTFFKSFLPENYLQIDNNSIFSNDSLTYLIELSKLYFYVPIVVILSFIILRDFKIYLTSIFVFVGFILGLYQGVDNINYTFNYIPFISLSAVILILILTRIFCFKTVKNKIKVNPLPIPIILILVAFFIYTLIFSFLKTDESFKMIYKQKESDIEKQIGLWLNENRRDSTIAIPKDSAIGYFCDLKTINNDFFKNTNAILYSQKKNPDIIYFRESLDTNNNTINKLTNSEDFKSKYKLITDTDGKQLNLNIDSQSYFRILGTPEKFMLYNNLGINVMIDEPFTVLRNLKRKIVINLYERK